MTSHLKINSLKAYVQVALMKFLSVPLNSHLTINLIVKVLLWLCDMKRCFHKYEPQEGAGESYNGSYRGMCILCPPWSGSSSFFPIWSFKGMESRSYLPSSQGNQLCIWSSSLLLFFLSQKVPFHSVLLSTSFLGCSCFPLDLLCDAQLDKIIQLRLFQCKMVHHFSRVMFLFVQ